MRNGAKVCYHYLQKRTYGRYINNVRTYRDIKSRVPSAAQGRAGGDARRAGAGRASDRAGGARGGAGGGAAPRRHGAGGGLHAHGRGVPRGIRLYDGRKRGRIHNGLAGQRRELRLQRARPRAGRRFFHVLGNEHAQLGRLRQRVHADVLVRRHGGPRAVPRAHGRAGATLSR